MITRRENEVINLIVSGYSNKEIARELYISVKTVKFHISNIYKKENVLDRTGLIIKKLTSQQYVEHALPMD